jgi:hypothetical protein
VTLSFIDIEEPAPDDPYNLTPAPAAHTCSLILGITDNTPTSPPLLPDTRLSLSTSNVAPLATPARIESPTSFLPTLTILPPVPLPTTPATTDRHTRILAVLTWRSRWFY